MISITTIPIIPTTNEMNPASFNEVLSATNGVINPDTTEPTMTCLTDSQNLSFLYMAQTNPPMKPLRRYFSDKPTESNKLKKSFFIAVSFVFISDQLNYSCGGIFPGSVSGPCEGSHGLFNCKLWYVVKDNRPAIIPASIPMIIASFAKKELIAVTTAGSSTLVDIKRVIIFDTAPPA